jgi:hypothetical protein
MNLAIGKAHAEYSKKASDASLNIAGKQLLGKVCNTFILQIICKKKTN